MFTGKGQNLKCKLKRGVYRVLTIEELQIKNQELTQIHSDIIGVTEKMFNHLKSNSYQTRMYGFTPLSRHCDLSHIRDKYYERICDFENIKKEILSKLKTKITPQKVFIEGLSIINIGGVVYSIITPDSKYEKFVEKYLEEVKMIETKDLGTIFAESCIKNIPNASFFSRCVRIKSDSSTFLIDLSSRKAVTLSKEKELNIQLDKIFHDENSCMVEMKKDITKLLNEEQKKNMILINDSKTTAEKAQSDLFDKTTRIDVLFNRLNICNRYKCNF